MKDDELTTLRRANPIDVDAVTRLVAAHGSALSEAIAETRDGSAPRSEVWEPAAGGELTPVRARRDARRPMRFNLLGAAAAAVVVLALPVLFLASATRSDTDIVETDLPPVDELPPPEDPGAVEVDPEVEDDLFARVPPSSHDTPGVAPTTVAPSATTSTPSSTSIDPDTDGAALPPVPLPAPTSSLPSQPEPPATSGVPAEAPPASPPSTPPTPEPSPATTSPSAATTTTTPVTTVATTITVPDDIVEPTPGRVALDPFDPDLDLLVITLDFANRDDGHASVAARELATAFDLDPLVVVGTPAPESGAFAAEYADVMTAAWGSAWLDAAVDRADVVADAADQWLATIDAGGVVRVAEGGVSDFSADVVREVQRRRPALDTVSVIQVVHHSVRNEEETRADDRDLVQTSTLYERIDDGNSANDTADLKVASDGFEAAALSGRHADAWITAFDFLPASSLDFSDTVTALHILGIGTDEVADPDDFATAVMR